LPLPQGFIKLNFDGASKGNPGLVGLGGVFRNEEGKILKAYARKLGFNNNNAAKLLALEEGLGIAKENE
jgi:ribonuclease HI